MFFLNIMQINNNSTERASSNYNGLKCRLVINFVIFVTVDKDITVTYMCHQVNFMCVNVKNKFILYHIYCKK